MSVLLRCLLLGVYEILSLLLYDEDYRTFAFYHENKTNATLRFPTEGKRMDGQESKSLKIRHSLKREPAAIEGRKQNVRFATDAKIKLQRCKSLRVACGSLRASLLAF